jgi:hypothetical protein
VIEATAMRALSTILLALLLLQTAGPLGLLQLQQSQVRREMKRAIQAGIPDAELRRFVFEADGRLADGGRVEWVEGHEFRYRGVMYDVARTRVEDGRTVRYCVRDDDETAVYAQLDRLIREENRGGERRSQSERILRHLFTPLLAAGAIDTSPDLSGTPFPAIAAPSTLAAERIPPLPPPEV